MDPAELEIMEGDEAGRILPLGERPITVGRVKSNVLVLHDTTVSRQHAKIFERDGRHWVADLNSSHGTYVNGAKVTRQVLNLGDEVRFGSTVLNYRAVGAAAAPAPPPAPEPAPEPPPAAKQRTARPAPAAAETSDEDGELSLEMPEDLLPRAAPAAATASPSTDDDAKASPPRSGVTEEGEDPFADEDDAVADEASFGRGAPGKGAGGKGGKGALYRDPRKQAHGSAGLLRQDLDQKSAPFRWVAVAVAIALTLGAGWTAMKLVTWSKGSEDESALDDEPRRPNRPLRRPADDD